MAISWARTGGVVTMCWHWNAPARLYDKAPDRLWWSGFYTRATLFRADEAMEKMSGDDYGLIIRDIDVIAKELKRLDEAGIPILWRPLHEASGGWFWWGASGPETYKALYRLMFDRLNRHHGLKNLIWVWNGQDPDWYPGDDVVDIVSEDVYAQPRDYSPQTARYRRAGDSPGLPKLIALSENGVVPDPAKLAKEKVSWSWFCTWSGDFVMDPVTRKYSEVQTEAQALKRFYADPFVITRDELPDFGYRAGK
jgi:mannan endo-1,4-beta-mannosidase